MVDKDNKHARLWILNVATGGETRALTKPNWNFDELAWLPAGDRVAVKGTEHSESDQYTERIFSVQVSDGTMKELVKPLGPFRQMHVAPDGKTISYVGSREDGPEPHDLMLLPVGAHAARNLTGASLDRLVQDYRWQKDGSVVLVAANGFSNLLVTYSGDGARHDLAPAPGPAGEAHGGDGERGDCVCFAGRDASAGSLAVGPEGRAEASYAPERLRCWKQFTLSEAGSL